MPNERMQFKRASPVKTERKTALKRVGNANKNQGDSFLGEVSTTAQNSHNNDKEKQN